MQTPDSARPQDAEQDNAALGFFFTDPATFTQPKARGASQVMLYVTGMTEEDMDKPQVGIASIWWEGNPCNMHLLDLAGEVKDVTHPSVNNPVHTQSTIDGTASNGGTGTNVAQKRFFRANEKTLNVLISKWLVSQDLSYTVCASKPFHDVISSATGNPSYPILSRERHDRLLNGQFQLFCDLVGDFVNAEFEKACRLKFLNLIHDIWTSSGKDSIVGASLAFIDSLWRFRFIAVLATVKNDGHKAPAVAKVIERDNIQTTTVWNDTTDSWDKVVKTVTPGGAFDEGGAVIQKLRDLNNHFKSSKQRGALKKIQEALSYPELDPMTDKDVRVAYTCKVIRRSVVNYSAYEAIFQSTKDSTSVWTALSSMDWLLAVEMEAVTSFVARLALVEAQSENLVSSYMGFFRRLAEKKLKSYKFDAMAIEPSRAKEANEDSHRRYVKTQAQFFGPGKTCLRRTLLQLQARFPRVTKEAMLCVLLDPRTKSSAKKLAADSSIPRKEEKAVYKDSYDFLRDEHRQVFAQMSKQGKIPMSQQASSQSSMFSQESTSPSSSPSSTGWDDEDELLLGAPIRARKTREEVKESEVNARVDAVVKDWLELEPEWLEVAQQQNPDMSKEDLSKDMTTDSHNGMCWALLGLYKHVDVLRWFREEGEFLFPSIALLVRIHLGKVSSSAFQERLFSTGGKVMGPLRTRTDSRRAEKQLLLRHNREEITNLKHDARNAIEPKVVL
ncbi:uncharacterized protein PITG_01836 [Phytophthora infestans T30-4]|uniref:HAT C-terminal dimerisation domain-containing protein n=1 Tax=Phytophthora infestans (strain T30-4) TaxID=403677 RepID=D0MU75_PHYIT|nr:uncharacterized protein PITG_01836 [Phytophthora infestans T30-4]EEY61522.1 conserved hypothetical protein [Phytophthora infestans T30-4]|eukprot:XP_002908439.1 conserved hypothetical protein [Phytophthora infestans T30-4]